MYHRNILVEQTDPELWAAIQAENKRQEEHIELIASENYASPAVLLAMGNWLSDKYAEGSPGHRFYAGCQNVDTVEALAALGEREPQRAEHRNDSKVLIDNQPVRGVGNERAVIFQEPRLLPWQTVLENVAFGLMRHGIRVNGLCIGWTDTPGEDRIMRRR